MTTKRTEPTPRPISTTERKALEKLVDEDFSILRGDLQQIAGEAKEAKAEAIRKEQRAVIAKARKTEDQIRDICRKARDEGFELKTRYSDDFTITVTAKSVDAEIDKAGREIVAELAVANQILSRRQHETHRSLLKATLSADAVALLDELPSAEALMREAVSARRLQLAKAPSTGD
jgi:hypothetical protein